MHEARVLSTVVSEESESQTNGGVPVDHERLRFVTRLLGAQGGLRTILFGTFLFWIEANHDVWHWHWPRGWAGGLAWLVGMVVFFRAWQRWIPRYYERRFGHVEPQEMSAKRFGILLLALLALALFGQPIANYFEPSVSSFLAGVHLVISDPAQQVNLYAPILWTAGFFSSLRWPLRRMERQRLCFELAGLIGFVSIAILPMWHPDAEKLGLWKVLNAGGLGLSFIAVGLYNHIVLIRALPRRLAEGDDE
jgi:hypothetical protein